MKPNAVTWKASPTATSMTSAPSASACGVSEPARWRRLGRWEESASLSEELLTDGGASPVNRINPLTSLGKVRARQGIRSCWECLDEAAATAHGSGEPQYAVLVRLARAEAYWLAGETAEAIREAELADDACARVDAWGRGAVAAWLRRTGSARPQRGDLAEPYRLQLAGDWAEAARLWNGLGCPYEAALALHDATDERGTAGGREDIHPARRLTRRPAHPAEDAPARHPVDPGRAAGRDPGRSARADPA